jgi:hypothetical protein
MLSVILVAMSQDDEQHPEAAVFVPPAPTVVVRDRHVADASATWRCGRDQGSQARHPYPNESR